MNIKKQKLWLNLGATENSFAFFQGSRNAKIEESQKNKETVFFEVSNLREASEVCQKYISYFNLGSGNWLGGQVIDDNNNFVARISYNGRVWDSEDLGKSKEIKI